jgi:site-specific DNA-cytosine methylase
MHRGGRDIEIVQVFVCDKVKSKQEWLLGVTSLVCCCFEQIQDLAKNFAKCRRHGCMCKVSGCKWFFLGFSCTSVSVMNARSNKNQHCMSDPNSTADTAVTFWAGIAYIKRFVPPVVIMENSDKLASDEKVDKAGLQHL